MNVAFWHQSTEWQCHVTANIQTGDLCSHTLIHTSTHNASQSSWKDIWTEYGRHTHTHTQSRHAQTHTCSNRTVSSVSDRTKWHFTITLWSEGREEVDLTKCLGMKGGLSHSLTKKVNMGQWEQASLWTDVSHIRSLPPGCHIECRFKMRPPAHNKMLQYVLFSLICYHQLLWMHRAQLSNCCTCNAIVDLCSLKMFDQLYDCRFYNPTLPFMSKQCLKFVLKVFIKCSTFQMYTKYHVLIKSRAN